VGGGAENVLSQTMSLNFQNNLEQLSVVPDSPKKKNSTSTQVRPCGTYKGFGHEARLVVHLLALRCQRTWSGKLGSG